MDTMTTPNPFRHDFERMREDLERRQAEEKRRTLHREKVFFILALIVLVGLGVLKAFVL